MSAMANVIPIIATVKNASVEEKTLKEIDAVPKASILDFCEEHYEDILPIILDMACHDKRKEVQTRLDFGESPKKRSERPLKNLPSCGTGRTLGNAYMVSHVQLYLNRGREAKEACKRSSRNSGETIEEFIERFKIKIGRMKGAPECMRISGFMHGVNNPELTKRLNEHVPKTVEEMMTATTTFIQGETAAASKKKVHTP
uniref:Reverse transcriptase domain-containing protein n=1 Tax=Tanacetum cinerariifolium TaxID=118510 RepID=A0A6L2JUW0_TANCI|nr:reverse transcriptase domain-containing protein [Tanacetum cinerariifolium]